MTSAFTALATAIGVALSPQICTPGGDPVARARAEIDRFEASEESPAAIKADIREALTSERSSETDSASLNWIRAIDPSRLPPRFPARRIFIKCAGMLQRPADAHRAAALLEWDECVTGAFQTDRPEEFQVLRACLGKTLPK
jgi:hypothetical protein